MTGTKLVRLEETRRGVRTTTENGCVITARRAVVAAGFETKELLQTGPGTLKSTYAHISEPLAEISGWHQRWLKWESGSPYLYLRTTPEGRIIVGGEEEDFLNAKRRDALITPTTCTLVKKISRLFPKLRMAVAYAWAGTLGETKDGLAYIGIHPRFRNCYFCAGLRQKWHRVQPHCRRDHPGSIPRAAGSRRPFIPFRPVTGRMPHHLIDARKFSFHAGLGRFVAGLCRHPAGGARQNNVCIQ